MPLRDHDPLSFSHFRGTYDRGEEETTPPGFFKSSKNIKFLNMGIASRDGFGAAVGGIPGGIRRIAIYKRLGEAPRHLILNDAGQIYDEVTIGLVLSIPAMTDFSMVSMFNRAYITPHNGVKGLPGQTLYVYDASAPARPAGGTGPSPTPMVAVEGAAGNFDAGIHLFAVSFESSSGFLSPFDGFVSLASTDGGKSVDLSSIPLGPTGTVARVLVGTKNAAVNDTFNGDYENQTWFFIPDGRIPNNFETTKTVSYFDADLQSESSYLLDQMGSIPAGVGINIYQGRLILWGEDLNESIIRASAIGQPESFDEADGFATINPGDSGGGVKYCFEYRTQLVCCKQQRSYITQDNGNPAAYWAVNALDKSVGTECHGVGKILDFGEDVRDRAFIADRSGLQLFTGTFADTEVSYNIADVWDRINKGAFHKIEVAVDPLKGLVYIAAPFDGALENNAMIVGDWQEGLSVEGMKWTVYESALSRPQTVVVDVAQDTKESVLYFAGLDASIIWKQLEDYHGDAASVPIDSWIEFPLLPQDDDFPVYHYTGIRVRAKGAGTLGISLEGLDKVQTAFVPSLFLSPAPGRPLFRGFNFTSERCSVKLSNAGFGEYYIINHFSLFHKVLWLTRAE